MGSQRVGHDWAPFIFKARMESEQGTGGRRLSLSDHLQKPRVNITRKSRTSSHLHELLWQVSMA